MQDGEPPANMFAAGEIMAGNVLGRGYAAGIGMTIGSVFGRIAGREAARQCTQLTRWREADRLMTVCNSCRYCEGLCAVFPAMEMRRALRRRRSQLPRQSLPWLRRLLRRLPVLAAARIRRQRAADAGRGAGRFLRRLCLAARARRPVRAQRPRDRAHRRAERRALFILGFVAWHDPAVLSARRPEPGAFYRLMPHNAMAALFGAALLYAIVAIAMSVRRFWRDIGAAAAHAAEAARALAGDQGRRPAALSRRRRRRLHERGRAARPIGGASTIT